jgi:hypothetical protein
MKVANLCDSCKQQMPECELTKMVFGVDCKDILAYYNQGIVEKKYLDAVVACDGYSEKE